MTSLTHLLLGAGIAMFVVAVGILIYDLYLSIADRWRTSIALAMLAWSPLLIATALVIVLSGTTDAPISQAAAMEKQTQAAVATMAPTQVRP